MLISIGILAWNEEENIEQTLISLFEQSVFQGEGDIDLQLEWEVIVVPNGCSDSTARISREVLSRCVSRGQGRPMVHDVVEVVQAGKSNAWNRFVHEFSNQASDLIIMIDADIKFGHPKTIENVLIAMRSSPHADVVVDLPLKSAINKSSRSLMERVSLKFSNISLDGPPGLCGQFYCTRGEVLRNIWMPIGLSGEDGFLKAMIVTDLFRSDVDERKIIRAEDASHFYEAESSITGIFKHQLRLTLGTSLNCYLTWDALKFMTDPTGPGAGVLIRNLMERDPDWYRKFLHNVVLNKGWWVLPRGMLLGRFAKLKKLSGINKLKTALVLFLGLLFDLPVFVVANNKIKSGRAIGYW